MKYIILFIAIVVIIQTVIRVIDYNNINTTQKSMYKQMYYTDCSSITDMPHIDLLDVIDMSNIFLICTTTDIIDVDIKSLK